METRSGHFEAVGPTNKRIIYFGVTQSTREVDIVIGESKRPGCTQPSFWLAYPK